MLNYFDVIKAQSGIPVKDIWAQLWGNTMSTEYVITTYEGTLPTTLTGTKTGYLESYKIYGNTVQSGTPTPESPVDVVGCGERTENVMPAGEQKTVVSNGVTFSSDGNGRYHISGTATEAAFAQFNLLSAFTTPISVSNGGQGTLSFFNTSSDINVSFVFYNGTTKLDDWRMYLTRRTSTEYNILGNKYVDSVIITVSSGVTVDMTITPEFTNDGIIPSEFEPYGYKLPMLSNSTATNIYLGEVETTRRIKKLVLTGEETSYMTIDASKNIFSIRGVFNQAPELLQVGGFCSHYKYNNAISSLAQNMSNGDFVLNKIADDYSFTIMDNSFSNGTDFNRYVQQQYAAGTPVTVWYVLAEPETGVVNEPLMKIANYADTISMEQADVQIPTHKGTTIIDYDGDPKSSQMYIKYKARR